MSQQVKTSGGRKINSARKFIEVQKLYDIEEAVRIAKNSNYAKFDANLDIAINLGIDPRQSDQKSLQLTDLLCSVNPLIQSQNPERIGSFDQSRIDHF